MGLLEKMNEGDCYLYSSEYFSGNYNQNLYLKRSRDDGSGKIKLYIIATTNINGNLVQQGYLYFYLDPENKLSDFIGVGVGEEYRNLNIGSLLVASWIDICLNNGYDFLGANKKQRKPFLLYLLKTYGFEIFDKSLYAWRDDVISICRSLDVQDTRKLLIFKYLSHENRFIKTNIYKSDDYGIVHDEKGIVVLDKVILPLQSIKKDLVKYYLLDYSLAEEKTMRVINRHKK